MHASSLQLPVSLPNSHRRCKLERVGIFGSADISESDPVYQEVFELCQELARAKKIIVDGGGPGVMAAATKGAEAVGGETIAVTFQPHDMPEFEGRYAGNEPDLEIKTYTYIERMFGLIEESDAFVIFKGGTGTLSEWATVWLLAHLQYGNHRPLVLYGDFWPDFIQSVNKYFLIGEKEKQLYAFARTTQEVMKALAVFEKDIVARCQQ